MDEKLAKDIHDCDDCPLNQHDCPGVVGTPNGYREPPCTSWNPDTIIYVGMYEWKGVEP